MRSRRSAQAAFSLFSFQDIITSVMGIIILVLLVMALELARRQLEVPAVQHALTGQQTTKAIEVAQRRIAELQTALSNGTWNELAGKTVGDLQREQSALGRLIPQLEADVTAARLRQQHLRAQREQAEAQVASRESDQTELERLTKELDQVKQELAKLVSSNTLLFRAGPTAGRQPWLIQISGAQILAAPLGPKSRPLRFGGSTEGSRQRQFLAWATNRDSASVYFILMVQPGGAAVAKAVERKLRDSGFGVGLDLLGDDQAAIDPEAGAPTVAPEEAKK